jgi:hypothetical protein
MKLKKSLFSILTLGALLSGMIFFDSCSSRNNSKGYDYKKHRKDNQKRVEGTRIRNKGSKSLINHKGKSVKPPRPMYP